MFIHQYIYRLKYLTRVPVVMFWALIFPMLLGTLFKSTFGTSLSKREGFSVIPAAVVVEQDAKDAKEFIAILKEISYSEDNKMFEITECTVTEADQLLQDRKIDGYFTIGKSKTLTVAENGFNVSIMKQFLDEYLRTESFITDIAVNQPEHMQDAVAAISSSKDFIRTVSLSGKQIDGTMQYYYALIAMVCLFGSYIGLYNAKDMQANQSAVAARRSVTPTKKSIIILADNLAALTLHFLQLVLVWLYLYKVLGINIGDQPGLFLLTCFVGSIIGVFMGQFIGAAFPVGENTKQGICTSTSLIMCFFTGLMVGDMKYLVETNFPLLNRINPAALITDAFYSLTVYDDYSNFTRCIVTLIGISIVLVIGSVSLMRRQRYESI